MELLTVDQIKRLIFDIGKRIIDTEILHKKQDHSDLFNYAQNILPSNKEDAVKSDKNDNNAATTLNNNQGALSTVNDSKQDYSRTSQNTKDTVADHESLYKHNVAQMLERCYTEQQKRIIRDVVHNSKRMDLKTKYDMLQHIKETLNLKIEEVDVPQESIKKLQEQHSDELDARLKQTLSYYTSGSLKKLLEQIGRHGSNLDMRHSPMLNILSTSCKHLKCKTPMFSSDIKANASKFNTRLQNYVMGRGVSDNPTIFDAVSLQLVQDESLSTVLKVLTYKEMQENAELVKHVCEVDGYNYKELPSQIFDSSRYATPPVLSLLAKALQKNIVVHWGAGSDKAFTFGNPSGPQVHLLAKDANFYPVYKIGKEPAPKFNFKPRCDVHLKQDSSIETNGTNFNDMVSDYTNSCNFCKDFKQHDCNHVTNKQIQDLNEFRRLLLNPNLGSMTAKDFDETLYNMDTMLPSWMKENVVTMKTSMDNSCVYNSISRCLIGTEQLALTLRRAIATDFLKNEQHYLHEFSTMKYNADDLIKLRENIFSNKSWGTDETLLLASKLTNRKIIVYSYEFQKKFYECTQQYDFNPQQSCNLKPILLVCKDRVHFEPAIPKNWDEMQYPTITQDQFKRFKPPSDILVSHNDEPMQPVAADPDSTNCNNNKENIGIPRPHPPLVTDEVNQVTASQTRSDVTPNEVLHETLGKANKVHVGKESDDRSNTSQHIGKQTNDTNETSNVLQLDHDTSSVVNANVTGDKITEESNEHSKSIKVKTGTQNMSASDMKEFKDLVEIEIQRFLKHVVDEQNVKTFVNNIMCCEKQFWFFRLNQLEKYKKHPFSARNKRARMHHLYCSTETARDSIASTLSSRGISKCYVDSFHQNHVENTENRKVQLKQGKNKHTRELCRINNEKCDYKPKTRYEEYKNPSAKGSLEISETTTHYSVAQNTQKETNISDLQTNLSNFNKKQACNAESSQSKIGKLGESPTFTFQRNEQAQTVGSFSARLNTLDDSCIEPRRIQNVLCNQMPEKSKKSETRFPNNVTSQTSQVHNENKPTSKEKVEDIVISDGENNEAPETSFTHRETLQTSEVHNENKPTTSNEQMEDIVISDDGNSDWETIEISKVLGYEKELKYVPPKEFTILIPSKYFSSVFNYNTERFVPKEWSQVISKYITKVQKCCSFTAERWPTYYAKKSKNGFCRLQGHCDGDCKIKFDVRIKETPEIGKSVTCDVTSSGVFKLIQNKPTGRQLRAGLRKRKAKKWKSYKPIKVLTINNNKMRTTPHRLLHNNHPQKSKDVLTTLRSENVKQVSKSKNPREDVFLFAKETKDNDKISKFVKGYVHHNNELDGAVTVHLYTEQSLKLLSSCCRNSKVSLHLDATGSVVKSPNEKQMLLYTIVARTTNGVQFAVADMLSQRGRGVDIGNFLQKLKHDYREVGASVQTPFGHVIVTDFSFAMLNGASSGINGMTLKDYISHTWDIQNNKKTLDPDRSVLYICTNHLVKAVSNLMSKHIPNVATNKELRNLSINSVVRMQECTDIMQLRETIEKICRTFGNRTLTAEELAANKKFITSKEGLPESGTEFGSLLLESESVYHPQLSKSSPYYQLFKNVREKYTCDEVIEEELDNPFYNTKVLDIIGNHYAPYVSLYSSMMIQKTGRAEKLRLTNGEVEAEFKVIKNYLQDDGKTQYNTFMRRHFDFQQGRLVNVIPACQRKNASKVKLKRLQKPKLQNSELHEETWSKRKTPRKNKYVGNQRSRIIPGETEIPNSMKTSKSSDANQKVEEQSATTSQNNIATNVEQAIIPDLPTPEILPGLDVSKRNLHNEMKNERRKSGALTAFDILEDEFEENVDVLWNIRNDLIYIEEQFDTYRKNKKEIAELQITKDCLNNNNTAAAQGLLQEPSNHADKHTRFGVNICEDATQPDAFLTFNDISYMVNPNNYMDDTHVDFYMSLITSQHPNTAFVITKSHFANKSINLESKCKIQPYTWQSTRQGCEIPYDTCYLRDYSDAPFILHPLRKINHWMLLGIERSSKNCVVFDSGRRISEYLQAKELKEIKEQVLPLFLEIDENAASWNVHYDQSFPRQSDVNNCGIYCVSAAEAIIKRNLDFKQFVNQAVASQNILSNDFDPMHARLEQVRNILSTTSAGMNVLLECGRDDKLLQDHFLKDLGS